MRKRFLTGLAILLPAVLTFMLFLFGINLLTMPFLGLVQNLLAPFDLPQQAALFLAKFLILLFLIGLTLLIGLLTRIMLFHYFLRLGNALLHRIPLINKIYKAAQDVFGTLFHEEGHGFSHVVLVPFPTKKGLCIGFVTNITDDPEEEHGNISVFLPATPNPTMGFMLLFKKEQLIFLDMKVDEALKFIVSCGIISPEWNLKEHCPKKRDAS